MQVAEEIRNHLKTKHRINELGVIITDSNITPLRLGVTGIAVGWSGFEPVYPYIGKEDLFGRKMELTYVNNIDALAAAAVFVMGEGNESVPICRITEVPRISFVSDSTMIETDQTKQDFQVTVDPASDLFAPLLKSVRWVYKK
jgi:F420-0:gamma-glutamyl ligase